MPKFKVESKEQESVTEFRLREDSGVITLYAHNHKSSVDCPIFRIYRSGDFYRHISISKSLGLQLDDAGRVKENTTFTGVL